MKLLLASLLFHSAAYGAKSETLWTAWYLITQKGSPVGYFEETAEKRPSDRQIAVTQKWVEKAGARTETYIGSVSGEEHLAPVAFFVERKGPKPYKTDARAKGKRLEVTFKPGSPDLAKSTEYAPLADGTFFSSFVPMAIARRFAGQKGAFAFTAVVEDGGDMDVEVKKGLAEAQPSEKKIGKEECRQVLVKFDGKLQEWWITKKGKTCLVEFPDSDTKMELSTEALAKKALGEK
ncbi:MAG TPA: hypothetical protein VIH99_03190 [Bdellovibrionota bacterium]|jgi:hypothetical protein